MPVLNLTPGYNDYSSAGATSMNISLEASDGDLRAQNGEVEQFSGSSWMHVGYLHNAFQEPMVMRTELNLVRDEIRSINNQNARVQASEMEERFEDLAEAGEILRAMYAESDRIKANIKQMELMYHNMEKLAIEKEAVFNVVKTSEPIYVE